MTATPDIDQPAAGAGAALESAAGKPPGVALLLPEKLAPYVGSAPLRTPWPLLLSPGRAPLPLAEALADFAAPGGQTPPRLLADNLLRLESWVRAALAAPASSEGAGTDAASLIEQAAEGMSASLALAAEPAAELDGQLSALVSRIPADSRFLAYGRDAALRLMLHQLRPQKAAARAAWQTILAKVAGGLEALLEVERAKDPDTADGDSLSRSTGPLGASFFDSAALARVVGKPRGGRRMEPERRERVAGLQRTLRAAQAAAAGPVMVVVGGRLDAPDVSCVESSHPCRDVGGHFDAAVSQLIDVARALRAAQLELDGHYDPAEHGPQAAALDWWHLRPDELAVLPLFVAVDEAENIVADDMLGLTRLLGGGRPVQVFVDVQAARNPGAGGDPLGGFRVELGQVGMALRQVLVLQSSPAVVDHCVDGFARVLDRGRAGLHLLCSGWPADRAATPEFHPWLVASSAVQSRAHPLFCYDPDAGSSWAVCLDAAANPDPEADWLREGADDAEDNGVTASAYTFADHALLDAALADNFRVPQAGGDNLVPVADWLTLDPAEASGSLPTVTVVARGGSGDSSPELRVVSEQLAFACRDRLHGWRSLRELAGFANEHARRAAAAARAEAEAAAAVERDALVSAHAEELERVRGDAAREAMQRLTASLLGTDWSAGALLGPAATTATPPDPAGSVAGATAAAPAPVAAAEEAAAPAPEALADEDEDAWVDSALCTSCNDCINLNGMLFRYDANKQATIGDPTAGSFEELVRAAELCPARCIHPGTPLDPDEPGLDDLVQRAARYR